MKSAPFQVNRLEIDSSAQRLGESSYLPAYIVISTATPNVEEAPLPSAAALSNAQWGIEAIARDLYTIQTTLTQSPELVIAVHGYNTNLRSTRAWYHRIYQDITADRVIDQRKNQVFVGYRWPSENIIKRPKQRRKKTTWVGNVLSTLWINLQHIGRNIRALPTVPQGLLYLASACLLINGCLRLWPSALDSLNPFGLLIRVCFPAAVVVAIAIFTVLVLRLIVYFRDVYRATNFGVPDLTELLRQIDQALVDLHASDLEQQGHDKAEAIVEAERRCAQSEFKKVKLTFLGHSMGSLVITNVVRVLSDVFDRRSIRKNPDACIGHTLSLGRLILVAPDIPVLTIVSSRANGFASSLRRFEETYLFSNEGDLALRLASTAANYISFPSATQKSGHRLGSIALADQTEEAGIINLAELRQHYSRQRNLGEAITADHKSILDCLFITSGKAGDVSLRELFNKVHYRIPQASAKTPPTLADLFTFFDCTDYIDYPQKTSPRQRVKRVRLLTSRRFSRHAKHLNLLDYILLAIASPFTGIDTHGGYFEGQYCCELIYRLAFLGFEEVLSASRPLSAEQSRSSSDSLEKQLDILDQNCIETGIQVYLSPLRYRVDIQGARCLAAKTDLIEEIHVASPSNRPDAIDGFPGQPSVSLAE